MNGLIGKKIGMTQVFDEHGNQVPVTVIEAGPCSVVQVKTDERDGYRSVQLGFGDQKAQRLNKPDSGHFKKQGVAPKRTLREIRLEEGQDAPEGDVDVTIFEGVTHVDITGKTKGRGFQGVVKRWNFGGGRKTHGGHAHRAPGSIGQCVSPARVMKGKKMGGHMGNATVTTQNLKVVQVRKEDNALLVKGAIPGPNGGIVIVRKALKKG